jgi:hypothetical protein
MERVGADGVEEIVLATNPTMTGRRPPLTSRTAFATE